jgi:hypothetical protein
MGPIGGRLGWGQTLGYGAIAVAAGAAFPRLLFWPCRPDRLGPRGLAVYIASNAVIGFALRTFFRRVAEVQERARTELAQTLGREPTEAELFEHFRLTCRR